MIGQDLHPRAAFVKVFLAVDLLEPQDQPGEVERAWMRAEKRE
jgi:hypothetical protein